MKVKPIYIVIALLLAVVLSISIMKATSVQAEEGYQINWWTVDGGGGVSSADEYTLMGTIGQHDAGSMGLEEYSLQGGFWVKGILEQVLEFIVNLPLVLR